MASEDDWLKYVQLVNLTVGNDTGNLPITDSTRVEDMIRFLEEYIKKGCYVDHVEKGNCFTLLDWSIYVNRLDFAKFLIESGASFKSVATNKNSLIVSIDYIKNKKSLLSFLALLIVYGANYKERLPFYASSKQIGMKNKSKYKLNAIEYLHLVYGREAVEELSALVKLDLREADFLNESEIYNELTE